MQHRTELKNSKQIVLKFCLPKKYIRNCVTNNIKEIKDLEKYCSTIISESAGVKQ